MDTILGLVLLCQANTVVFNLSLLDNKYIIYVGHEMLTSTWLPILLFKYQHLYE